jgi:hypothetical protein
MGILDNVQLPGGIPSVADSVPSPAQAAAPADLAPAPGVEVLQAKAAPAEPPAFRVVGRSNSYKPGDRHNGLEFIGPEGGSVKDPSNWKTLRGDDFLASFPHADHSRDDLIRAIANYQLPPGSARGGLGTPEMQGLLNTVVKYDPKFDAKQYKVRQEFLSEFNDKSAPNTLGGQLQAIDRVSQHALDFDNAAHALHNWDIPYVPLSAMSVINKIKSAGDRNAQGSADQAQQSYSMEAPKVVMGSVPNEPEINAQRGISDPYLPNQYTEGTMQDFARKIGASLVSVQNRAKRVWGAGGVPLPAGSALISPEAAQAAHKLLGKYNSAAEKSIDWNLLTAGGFNPGAPDAGTKTTPPAPAGVDPKVWAHVAPEKRALWQTITP